MAIMKRLLDIERSIISTFVKQGEPVERKNPVIKYNETYREKFFHDQMEKFKTNNKLIEDNLNKAAENLPESMQQAFKDSMMKNAITMASERNNPLNKLPKAVRDKYDASKKIAETDVKDQLTAEADNALQMYNSGAMSEEDFVKTMNNLSGRYNYGTKETIVQMQGASQIDNLNSVLNRIKKQAETTTDRAQAHRIRSTVEKIQDYQQQFQAVNNATTAEDKMSAKRGLDSTHKRLGIKNPKDAAGYFEQEANKAPDATDYIMGYHMPQTALGGMVLYGAVSNVFSNKGRVSNSQLYNPY